MDGDGGCGGSGVVAFVELGCIQDALEAGALQQLGVLRRSGMRQLGLGSIRAAEWRHVSIAGQQCAAGDVRAGMGGGAGGVAGGSGRRQAWRGSGGGVGRVDQDWQVEETGRFSMRARTACG